MKNTETKASLQEYIDQLEGDLDKISDIAAEEGVDPEDQLDRIADVADGEDGADGDDGNDDKDDEGEE